MKPLTIEIHGVSTYNRGAELMAVAIAEKLRSIFAGVRIVVSANFGDFDTRARYQFWTTLDIPGRFRAKITETGLRFSSPMVRSFFGIVPSREVDVVLDASGFAYSDHWGDKPARAMLTKMQLRCRRHQHLIMMPQAFGPFTNAKLEKNVKRLIDRADLIYARDDESLENLCKLGSSAKIQKGPDFTMPLVGKHWQPKGVPSEFVAIVPNYRMLDKTASSDHYLQFMEGVLKCLLEKNMNPVFLLHDAVEDEEVLKRLKIESPLPVVRHSDPLVLKGVLGSAKFVVGSRFHALVSALSQGVPSICVGWAHKYQQLFREFGISRFLVCENAGMDQIRSLIQFLQDDSDRREVSRQISNVVIEKKLETDEMWREIENAITKLL